MKSSAFEHVWWRCRGGLHGRGFRFGLDGVLVALAALGCGPLLVAGEATPAAEFHVAPDGDDANPGTPERPFRTLARGRDAVRRLKEGRNGGLPPGGVTVWVAGGRHELQETFVLRPEDSGAPGSPIVYRNRAGELPVFSGGRRITNWRRAAVDLPDLPAAARGRVWVADVSDDAARRWIFRQLWKDGERLPRARWPNEGMIPFRVADASIPSAETLKGFKQERKHSWRESAADTSLAFSDSPAVVRWREASRRAWRIIDCSRHAGAFPGGVLPADLARGDAELVCRNTGRWAMIRVPVGGVDGMRLRLAAPAGYLSYYWGGMRLMSPEEGVGWIENSIGLMDHPGEWYLDREAGRVHYLAREGEDPNACELVAARLEQLVRLEGTEAASVGHVELRGLAFEHAEWPLPPFGYRPFLGGWHGTEATPAICNPPEPPGSIRSRDEFPEFSLPAAVDLVHAERCLLERCRIGRVGATAVGLAEGCRNNRLIGCEVFDAGGNGIHVGLAHGTFCSEDFGWRRPDDEPQRNEIASCHVHHTGVMDWGTYGILNSYAEGSRIVHNLVEHLPYSGIAACFSGYVFPTGRDHEVKVENNHIHHVMQNLFDGGAIYTKDGVAASSKLRGNLIHDVGAGDRMVNGIFLDDGSYGFRLEDNIIHRVAHPVRFNRCRPEDFGWSTNYFGTERENPQIIGERLVPIALNPPPASADAAAAELRNRAGPEAPYRTTTREPVPPGKPREPGP